ncbi:MAG TPA: DUF6644 family protein [SAR86 cluster bacterium]|nr:DUF6644 family protein [SAR86 cluster bacterium]|tara:strand:- start:5112 stop:5585 length:474 start_codon:yes stop_codon:yes gene_type:complete
MDSKELIDIFYFLEDTFIGDYIRSSTWLFPVIESFHLIGLGILGGSVVLMDFKLMKLIFRNTSNIYILEQTKNFFIVGLSLLIITGVPLFLSEAVKCYYSRAFWIKIISLVMGVLFVYFVRNPLIVKKEGTILILIGFVSFSIWTVVAASGRWIGFS